MKERRKDCPSGGLWRGALALLFLLLAGCSLVEPEQEKKQARFVVVGEDCVPEELMQLIEEKKEEVMKLTYMDEGRRYIVIGYGRQESGGYSIAVKEVYATENALYVDTVLLGPKEKREKGGAPSYPFIVLQTMELGLPVVFE